MSTELFALETPPQPFGGRRDHFEQHASFRIRSLLQVKLHRVNSRAGIATCCRMPFAWLHVRFPMAGGPMPQLLSIVRFVTGR